MKKRITLGFFSILMLLFSFIALVSCDEDSGGNNDNTNQNQTPSEQECEHSYGAWVEITAATCTKAGEEKRTCSKCFESETRAINKLEHSYEAASCELAKKCKVCGTTEGEALGHTWVAADCDSAKTCSVCEKTEGNALGHTWVDADCDTPKTCSVCEKTEGEALGHKWDNLDCEATKTCTVCNEVNDTPFEHDLEEKTIILNNIVTCGASADVIACKVCDKIVEITDFDNDCEDIGYEELEFIEGEYQCHSQVMICDDCDCTLSYTYKVKLIDLCHYEVIEEYSVYHDENKNRTISYSYIETEHDCEYDYDMNGDSCADGYIITATCTNCGDVEQSELQYDHMYPSDSNGTELDLSTFGVCGGDVYIDECILCDYVYVYGNSIYCENFENSTSEYVDDDGITHYVDQATCTTCHITFKTDQYEKPTSLCETNIYKELSLIDNNVVKFVGYEESIRTEHDLETTSSLLGDSCEDGYYYHIQCRNCSYSEEDTIYHHEYVSKQYEIENACGGYINYDECSVCHANMINDFHLYCGIEKISEETETVLDVLYNIVYYECKDCDLSYTEKNWLELDGCKLINHFEYEFKIGNEVFFKSEKTEQADCHSYVVTSNFKTAEHDCSKGVEATIECENCDYILTITDEHFMEPYEELIVKDNVLVVYIEYMECLICNVKINLRIQSQCHEHINTTVAGYEDYETLECIDCGAIFLTKEEYGEAENCQRIVTCNEIILYNDEKLIDYTYVYAETYHDLETTYNFYGDDCNDGCEIINECKNCDYYESTVTYSHECETMYIYPENSCEDCVFSYSKCINCDFEGDFSFNASNCQLDYTEDGCECSVCNVKYTTVEESSIANGCEYTITYKSELSKNSVVLYTGRHTGTQIRHTTLETVVMQGSKCEDGLVISRSCSVCHEQLQPDEIVNGHYYDYDTQDLSDLGMCQEVSYEERTCLGCNKKYYAELYHYCSLDENGLCSNCGFTITIDDVKDEITDDCERLVHRIITIKNTLNETVFNISVEFYETDLHNYVDTAELLPGSETCDDGVLITSTCTRCNHVTQCEANYHVTTINNIDLSQYGVCSGVELAEEICTACNKVMSININTYCWDSSNEVENGMVHSCSICNTTLKELHSDTQRDSECRVVRTYIYELYNSNEEKVLTKTFERNEQVHDHQGFYTLLGESCTDGILFETKCIYCNEIVWSDTLYEHNDTYPTYIYIEGSCEETSLQLNQCLCKEKTASWHINGCLNHVSTEEEEINGYMGYIDTYECSTCSISLKHSYYMVENAYYHTFETTSSTGVVETYNCVIIV